jgi:hypothetical protein
MNKILMCMMLIATLVVMSFAVVSAEDVDAAVGTQPQDGTGVYHDDVVAAGGLEGEGAGTSEGIGAKIMAQEGELNLAGGKMQMSKVGTMFRLQANGVNADCPCEFYQDETQTRLYARMSNGDDAEVKVMPDVASQTALNKLRLQTCDGECILELKEVRVGSETRMAYELQTQRQSKVLGLFGAEMQVRAQVDAETGEIVRTQKPWWAFLASESEETSEEVLENSTE